MHRWCLLNLTVQGFSLNLTVRGVSNKHCLLTFFIESNLSRRASLKPQNKTALNFNFSVTYNVHSNVRMATGCVDSIFNTQWSFLMTSLKLITTSF